MAAIRATRGVAEVYSSAARFAVYINTAGVDVTSAKRQDRAAPVYTDGKRFEEPGTPHRISDIDRLGQNVPHLSVPSSSSVKIPGRSPTFAAMCRMGALIPVHRDHGSATWWDSFVSMVTECKHSPDYIAIADSAERGKVTDGLKVGAISD